MSSSQGLRQGEDLTTKDSTRDVGVGGVMKLVFSSDGYTNLCMR